MTQTGVHVGRFAKTSSKCTDNCDGYFVLKPSGKYIGISICGLTLSQSPQKFVPHKVFHCAFSFRVCVQYD